MPIAQSSHIQSYDYNHETGVLTVEFTNGSRYLVTGVPLHVYDEFHRSGSKGSYWHAKIKSSYTVSKAGGPRE